MPGDIIKVKDGKLIINGESAKYKELREDTKILKNGRVVKASSHRNFTKWKII